MRVVPRVRGGGPEIEPSTASIPADARTAAMRRTTVGPTALRSTTRGRAEPAHAAISAATSTAAPGGRTERTTSASRTSDSSEPTSSSPTFAASRRVRSLRPARATTTCAPPSRSRAPSALPIAPAETIPTTCMPDGYQTPPEWPSRATGAGASCACSCRFTPSRVASWRPSPPASICAQSAPLSRVTSSSRPTRVGTRRARRGTWPSISGRSPSCTRSRSTTSSRRSNSPPSAVSGSPSMRGGTTRARSTGQRTRCS